MESEELDVSEQRRQDIPADDNVEVGVLVSVNEEGRAGYWDQSRGSQHHQEHLLAKADLVPPWVDVRAHVLLLDYDADVVANDRKADKEFLEVVQLRISSDIGLAHLLAAVLLEEGLPLLGLRVELRPDQVHGGAHAHQNEEVARAEVEDELAG